MTDPHREPFDNERFRNHKLSVEQIIEHMSSATADDDRRRCLVVEGPARHGKTWLLQYIEHQISVVRKFPNLLACYFDLASIAGAASPNPRLYHRVWQKLHDHIPPERRPAGLRDLAAAALTDDLLQEHLTDDLLPSIAVRLTETLLALADEDEPTYLLLIVDGLDEFDQPTLNQFELQFVAELFRASNVRLLSSRRSDTPSLGWRHPHIRRQRDGYRDLALNFQNSSFLLGPLEHPEHHVQLNDQCERENLKLKPQQLEELQKKIPNYGWDSPGINELLVKAFKRNKGKLTKAALRECLRALMFTPRLGKVSDKTYKLCEQLAAEYQDPGLSDAQITRLTGLTQLKDRADLESELVERGALRRDGVHYRFSTDMISLFRALQSLER